MAGFLPLVCSCFSHSGDQLIAPSPAGQAAAWAEADEASEEG